MLSGLPAAGNVGSDCDTTRIVGVGTDGLSLLAMFQLALLAVDGFTASLGRSPILCVGSSQPACM